MEFQRWGFHAGVNRGRMTLQALRLPIKIVPSPDNREQEDTMTVYGGTGEVAMNAGHTEILFLASNRASIAIV
jgi:hypothetical protein